MLADAPTMAIVFTLGEDVADVIVGIGIVVHASSQRGGRLSRKAAAPSAESGWRRLSTIARASKRVGLVERHVDLAIERALADRQRRRRTGGDALSERVRFGERRAGRDDAIDEAEALGGLSVVKVAGQRHFHRVLARNGAADGDQRRRAEEADRHAGQGEARVGAGDREVAGGDELAAGGGGDAFDGGDHRLRQGDDGAHQVGAARHRALKERAAAVGVVAMRLQLLEVVAGRKRRPVAGENDDARRGIGFDRREGVDQRFDHRQAQRVARSRRLQSEGRDAAPVLAARQSERFFAALRGGHAGAPPSRLWPYVLAAARTMFAHAIASDSASWWLSAMRSFAQTSESLVGWMFQTRREICTVQRNGSDGARIP